MIAVAKGSFTAGGGRRSGLVPLTHARERELVLRWRNQRDPAAADALAKAHLPHVVATAMHFRRYGISIDELVAEGSVGMVNALIKFDPERGTRFVTYATHWIRAKILGCVVHSWSMVGSGAGALRSKYFFRLRRERARVSNLFRDEGEARSELAKRLDVSLSQLSVMLDRLDKRDVSLDGRTCEAAAPLLDSQIAQHDDQETCLVNDQSRGHRAAAVRSALLTLDERERFIAENRLMADQDDELSLAEVGRRFGVSRERVRQLEVRAKEKLRTLLGSAIQQ